MEISYVIGVDYGTDSVRSVLVNAFTGEEICSSVFFYPRWKQGLYCQPAANCFRQHPLDHLKGLETTLKDCVRQAGSRIAMKVVAISIATTGSTPVAVDRTGTPLSLLPGLEENPNAMFVLWKDHTATLEATQINEHAARYKVNYLGYVGGIYSSEWFWAKLLHIIREDGAVREACYSWVEHCDWIPFLLTGGRDVHKMKRSVCAAGHKALWSPAFGGLPPNDFFVALDPLLEGFTSRLYTETHTADQAAGTLSPEWAARLGLPMSTLVGVGAFDAHMGAVGGQIEPYYLSKVMGTSTCDMLVSPEADAEHILVKGICGQVMGSIIPGMLGMEAGQSAFGDVYAWFGRLISWPIDHLVDDEKTRQEVKDKLIDSLSAAAARLSLQEQDELAIDWLNGRRTPDTNQLLKGAITGLNLATGAPQAFRAIAEATCFGAKAIVDRFIVEGIPVKGLIGLGGVAKKSPFIMQMMADVMNRPLRVHRSEQACAAGAAMFAATVAGIYPVVEQAMQAMGQGFDTNYFPDEARSVIYSRRYEEYKRLGKYLEAEMR